MCRHVFVVAWVGRSHGDMSGVMGLAYPEVHPGQGKMSFQISKSSVKEL